MKLLYFLTFANGLRGNFKKKKNQSNLQSKSNVKNEIELPFMARVDSVELWVFENTQSAGTSLWGIWNTVFLHEFLEYIVFFGIFLTAILLPNFENACSKLF